MSAYQETAITITVPNDELPGHYPRKTQVLVRVPGHIDPAAFTIDFRPDPSAIWTPSQFFEGSVEVVHQ